MSLFDLFRRPDPETQAIQAANAERLADIEANLRIGRVPRATQARLEGVRSGALPWLATLTPAELRVVRSHGLRPVASVSATCWMHYGWSWTEGHAQGWSTALQRLKAEAKAAGAHAVLDVKMRTVPLTIEHSMDFTLVGTAVTMDGMAPSDDPVVATVPALEFVKLVEADVVPVGIAVGAKYDWLNDWQGNARRDWAGNVEATRLTQFWEAIRRQAHRELRTQAQGQGNGVLAHVNFSQMFEFEGEKDRPNRYLGRHIVVATVVEAPRAKPFRHDITMMVDMHAGKTPLQGGGRHHQAYASNDEEGAI